MPTSTFKKTTVMRMIEAAHGKPIDDVVVETFNRHGTYEKAAEELGVSVDTLRDYWMPKMGLEVRTIAEKALAEKSASPETQ